MCGGGRLMLSFLHLTVFETLLRLKSVTQAAEALDLPQPTLSRHLKYLRSHFDNPLFVRTSKGLEPRSEEHTSELQSLMRISYAVFCLKKKKTADTQQHNKD